MTLGRMGRRGAGDVHRCRYGPCPALPSLRQLLQSGSCPGKGHPLEWDVVLGVLCRGQDGGGVRWRRIGMCGTTTSTASVEGGGSDPRAVALLKALNRLKYGPARRGSKRAVRSERETTSPLYRIIHRPPFSTEVIFLLSPASSG